MRFNDIAAPLLFSVPCHTFIFPADRSLCLVLSASMTQMFLHSNFFFNCMATDCASALEIDYNCSAVDAISIITMSLHSLVMILNAL